MMTNDGFCNILHCHTQYFYHLWFFSLWCGLIVAFALESSLFCCLPMNVVSNQVNRFLAVGGRAYITSQVVLVKVLLQSFCNARFWPGF
jgi:hypothetical protein